MAVIFPSAQDKHAISVSLVSNQSIPSTLTFSKVNLSRVDALQGPSALWDAANNKIVIQRSGLYIVSAGLLWVDNNLEIQGLVVNDGSADIAYQAITMPSGFGIYNMPLMTSVICDITAGTSLEYRARQQNGGGVVKTLIGATSKVVYLSVMEL